jgi:hypothetical protein
MDPTQPVGPDGFMQSLLARMTPQSLLGSGAIQKAAMTMQSRPYQIHMQEARSLGQTPLTPEQFEQTRRGLLPAGS